MRSRITAYVILLLCAILLGVLPAAMWPDLVLPMSDNWNNWYWRGQPHPRPNFSIRNPPKLFAVELRAFQVLAVPPGYARKVVVGWPTTYASPWLLSGGETGGWPPLAYALEHFVWAVPLWLALLATLYESGRWLGALRKRGSA